ncbi:hypothetical protein BSKO_06833 [Bryopsis sp. KO-2023]|nr:hypothetical protein BSKO_06833 [Bryopsis sp. KO-2023]
MSKRPCLRIVWDFCVDSFFFLWSYLLSFSLFGSVLTIRNRSDVDVAIFTNTHFAAATGWKDWTVPDKSEENESKRKAWRVSAGRFGTFSVPPTVSLTVLSTEGHFMFHFGPWKDRTPEGFVRGDCPSVPTADSANCAAALWTVGFWRVHRATVDSDLGVETILKHGWVTSAWGEGDSMGVLQSSGKFSVDPDHNFDATVKGGRAPGLLIPDVRVKLPMKDEEVEQREALKTCYLEQRTPPMFTSFLVFLPNALNELSSLMSLMSANGPLKIVLSTFIVVQLMVWNVMGGPPFNNKAWSDYQHMRDFDSRLFLVSMFVPGFLQAFSALVINPAHSGPELLTALLAFANLAAFMVILYFHIWHGLPKNRRCLKAVMLPLFFVFVGFYVLMVYSYYYGLPGIFLWIAGLPVVIGTHVYFAFIPNRVQYCVRNILVVKLLKGLGKMLNALWRLFIAFGVWMVGICSLAAWEKFGHLVANVWRFLPETLIGILVVASVGLNAYVIFGVQGWSIISD